jgi:hypothetical protein
LSRSRRRIDGLTADEVWVAIDRWADDAVDPIALRARWSALATPTRGVDRFIDVPDRADARAALSAAGVPFRPVRPERRALGRTGEVALRPDAEAAAALATAGVEHRVVLRARRYQWRGPLTGPTFCEISSGPDDGPTLLEAWHEPTWSDSLRPRLTGDGADRGHRERTRPSRRVLQARASINRLLDALGSDPIRSD